MKIISTINRISNVWRFAISVAVASLVAILNKGTNQPSVHWMSIWLAFSLTNLFFSWCTIRTCRVNDIKKVAKDQDSGRAIFSLFMLLTTSISLVGILLLYVSAGEKSGTALLTHVLLTLLSAGSAWVIVHTTFTFKYAHLYYSYGGLDFPGEKNPDYMDFVYFSFVIGTTFQVSDVSITGRKIRHTAWMHGLLSFTFNTTILSLNINVISSLVSS